MFGSGHFSVVTAGALVLGGVAAIVLAVAVAGKESKQNAERAAAASVTGAGASGGGASIVPAPSGAERAAGEEAVEYQLDTSEP